MTPHSLHPEPPADSRGVLHLPAHQAAALAREKMRTYVLPRGVTQVACLYIHKCLRSLWRHRRAARAESSVRTARGRRQRLQQHIASKKRPQKRLRCPLGLFLHRTAVESVEKARAPQKRLRSPLGLFLHKLMGRDTRLFARDKRANKRGQVDENPLQGACLPSKATRPQRWVLECLHCSRLPTYECKDKPLIPP